MIFYQANPHPALQNYIAQYLYIFLNNIKELGNVKQIVFPTDISSLGIFSEKLTIENSVSGVKNEVYANFSGLITSAGSVSFKENESVFTFLVVFKPYGF